METPADHPWFLRKHEDGSVFGPLAFAQLVRWASSAQVAPHDSISTDQVTWMKAPMLPDLGMDWIAELTSERLYGPTTLGAIREFLRRGEIDQETFVIDTCDGKRKQVREIAPLLEAGVAGDGERLVVEEDSASPSAPETSMAVQDRIGELEQALREERRATAEAEELYRGLEAKYNQMLAATDGRR